MKITVASDDGKLNVNVPLEDIDWIGHSLNRVVLENRVLRAINQVYEHENPPKHDDLREATQCHWCQ